MEKKKKILGIFKDVAIPSFLILIIAVVVNFFVYKLELNFFHNIYNNEIIETKALINRRFQSALMAAEGIGALFISSEDVTEQEFELFGSTIVKNSASGILAMSITVEWVDSQNNIRYIYPMDEDNAKIVNMNLNQYPNRLLPITKAKTTKLPVVTEPIMLGQGYPGVILYSPIFKGDEYLGQGVVVIRLSNLVAPVAGSASIYEKNEFIQTGSFIIPFGVDVIFDNAGKRIVNPQGDLVVDAMGQKYLDFQKESLSESLALADKNWQLKFSPSYATEVHKRVAIYIGVSVLALLFITVFLWMLHKRREMLIEEMARAEALIASIGDGLIVIDGNGIIIFANRKAEEISGYGAKDAVGKSYLDFWLLVDNKGNPIKQEARPFYQAILTKGFINITMEDHLYVLKKDGSRFPLSSTIAPIVIDGTIIGSIMTFRDITKESEVDRMKSEFLSLATHQLLTPISATKWIAETVLNEKIGSLNENQKGYIQDIQVSMKRAGELVNALLNISRIESGRLMIKPEMTSLRDLLDGVIKDVVARLEEKNQKVDTKVDSNLPMINVDLRLVREIFMNFITNAIKYSPKDSVITVNIEVVGNEVVSSVSDNGYGIPESEQYRVFEKFYRGENIVEKERDGNGLGLYLVKQIVEASGGKVWFKSEINKGTTFWFSLPLSGSVAKAGEVSIT
ncbi:MAG TPA: ATP-binding protein [Candidatus Paceibacterota bacterium]|nr:ATP-binding protein [Candidatus Paceibacterota bacterium]HPT40306.1 ATP-binding protein [Candidatus Paceibacterota bacterium]